MPKPQLSLVPGTQTWSFTMLNEDRAEEVLELISRTDRPYTTLAIWLRAILKTDWNTMAVTASGPDLAKMARIPNAEAHRALSTLAQIGALKRVGRGKYEINPHVSWRGDPKGRKEAQAKSDLRLVAPEHSIRLVPPTKHIPKRPA